MRVSRHAEIIITRTQSRRRERPRNTNGRKKARANGRGKNGRASAASKVRTVGAIMENTLRDTAARGKQSVLSYYPHAIQNGD